VVVTVEDVMDEFNDASLIQSDQILPSYATPTGKRLRSMWSLRVREPMIIRTISARAAIWFPMMRARLSGFRIRQLLRGRRWRLRS